MSAEQPKPVAIFSLLVLLGVMCGTFAGVAYVTFSGIACLARWLGVN